MKFRLNLKNLRDSWALAAALTLSLVLTGAAFWRLIAWVSVKGVVSVAAPIGLPVDAYRLTLDGALGFASLPSLLRPERVAVCVSGLASPLAASPVAADPQACESGPTWNRVTVAIPAISGGTLQVDYARGRLLAYLAFLTFTGAGLGWVAARRMSLRLARAAQTARTEATARIAEQVAHDIKSPLAALGAAQKSIESVDAELGELIQMAVTRIREISKDLTVSTSSKAGPGACSLFQTLREVIRLKKMERHSGVEIQDQDVLVHDQAISVPVTEKELARVFSNLLNNAIEATLPQGTVKISFEAEEKFITVSISDSGRGIPEKVLSKLGPERFTFGKFGGSGLGLSHAFKTVEASGGRLAIESKVGAGTKVSVKLPIAQGTTLSSSEDS
jgi:signal transduction histidine kinase